MNTIVTSKEEILNASREMLRRQGWSGISIRSVASACGVSVGCIYNYFDSKAELVGATVESVWHEIFQRSRDEAVFQDVPSCIAWIYRRMEYGSERYPDFFTLHSLGFVPEERSFGRRRMQETKQRILDDVCSVLKRDKRIRADAFTDRFTMNQFADILLSLMTSAMLRRDYDPSVVLEIVRRILY